MAKKLESNFKNIFLVLLVTTIVAALALNITYYATKDAIAKAKEAKLEAAIKDVIPDFDELIEQVVIDASGNEIKIFDCLKDGEKIGVAIESYTMKGFSGKIEVMVGFRLDGTITKTVVLGHSETPGLGDKIDASKDDFPRQFWNKNIADLQTNNKVRVKKDGGKIIDAITAATISSRAFCDAIDHAWETYQYHNKEGGK